MSKTRWRSQLALRRLLSAPDLAFDRAELWPASTYQPQLGGTGRECRPWFPRRYAYDDVTCDEACIVVEGIYWASVSYMGGLYTQQRAASIQYEWLLATPDASMAVEPPGN